MFKTADGPSKRTRLRTTRHRFFVLAAVLVAGALASLGPGPHGVAEAHQLCPAASRVPGISRWEVSHGPGRGVVACKSVPTFFGGKEVTVQVVDFSAGARMRVMSQAVDAIGNHWTQFNKRTAPDWWTWVKNSVGTPRPEELFSVTNGSFFMDHLPWTATSAMSFPEKKWNALTSLGAETLEKRKRIFGLTDPRGAGQQWAAIREYPNNFQSPQAEVAMLLSPFFDATVGLHPNWGDTGSEYRTYVGLSNDARRWMQEWQDHAYILATDTKMTLVEAREILTNDFGAMWTIQMDGSGSTQLVIHGQTIIESGDPFVDRRVPEVLLVYLAAPQAPGSE